MKHLLFFLFILFSSILFSQAILPTYSDFSEPLPYGWSSNTSEYYSASGNPAPALKFSSSGKYLLIHTASTPGIVSFDIVGNGVQSQESLFKVQESSDNITFTDVGEYNSETPNLSVYSSKTLSLNNSTRYIKFIYVNKDSSGGGNFGLDNVLIEAGETDNQELKIHVNNNHISNNSTQYIGAAANSTQTLPFSIENSGLIEDLKIYSIDISGQNNDEFTFDSSINFPFTISATSTQSIGINFHPLISGPHTATVTIQSNDIDSPIFSFNILGYGDYFDDEPTSQPTNLTFSEIKTYRFKCTFESSDADGFLILMKKNTPITEVPQDGQSYSTGDIIGGAKVIASTSNTSFFPREVIANTEYHFAIFAYNGDAQFINYLTDNPLTGSIVTPLTMVSSDMYSYINTSAPTLIDDLHELIAPHLKNTYASFKDKLIEYFYERDTVENKKVLTCLYTGVGITREHTFAYSWYPINGTGTDAYSDYHNLFPIHQNRANVIRSNYPLGIVEKDTMSVIGEGILGRNYNDQIVYEPKDEQKGDAARAILYMCLRYSEDGVLWNLPSQISSSVPYNQDQEILKQWNFEDLPDGLEIARNDFIDSLQGNRNPFIDNPEFVCYIDFTDMTHIPEGCEEDNTVGLIKHDSLHSLNIYPNPASDKISVDSPGTDIKNYKFYNLTGNIVIEKHVNNLQSIDIDISSLRKGFYLIEITTERESITKKILVK